MKSPRYVPDAAVWRTPPIRPQGFQFEVQLSSLGKDYDLERVKRSIQGHNLGEYDSALSKTIAAEWGYSFTHLDGQTDGAGRRIQAGYPSPPRSRAACLPVIAAFLQRQYIMGAPHPWASMNGHFPWHHYAAELGFDQLGSEIGENINSYQWHIALTRGAARQYARPWFMDFSAWHGPSITDYSPSKIWGENSGPEHGHSLSLFERSLFLCYLSGAGQLTAEAGGAIAFLPTLDTQGRYPLSPYGEVCKRLRDFSLAHPEIGTPLTPFGIVLDFYHGAYPGFGKRKAFWHFDYNAGDIMTWNLIDLIWPGGWEVMGKEEVGTLVSGPFGDTFDILLQNASQKVLNSYPCLILSGDLTLSPAEAARYVAYVRQGGTLLLNTAFLRDFPSYARKRGQGVLKDGKGRVLIYGPDFDPRALSLLLPPLLAQHLPVQVSPGIEYLVNQTSQGFLVTLLNNKGVTKAFRSKAVVDRAQAVEVTVSWPASLRATSVTELKNQRLLPLPRSRTVTLTIPAGEVAVLEIKRAP